MVRSAVQGDAHAKARIEDSAELVTSTSAAIENIVAELRPPLLEDYGLAAALDWHAKQFTRRVGIAVSVQAAARRGLPAEVEMALFRIAQEALTNVAKHAHASRVVVTFEHSPSEFVMSIADDGIGLPTIARAPEGQRSSLGLVTMRERAQAVGGTFEAEVRPEGRGTRLTVSVAL
jgi:signal transduction histidine kinase